jgi:putative endonuclease
VIVCMTSPSQHFGRSAEILAEQWLQKKGYRILARNLRLGGGELDLIAQDHDTLVFIEVKGRQTDQYGGAPYAIDDRKKRQIIKLASYYLSQHGLSNQLCRFDVILVTGTDRNSPKLTHLEQAFEVSSSDWQW